MRGVYVAALALLAIATWSLVPLWISLGLVWLIAAGAAFEPPRRG